MDEWIAAWIDRLRDLSNGRGALHKYKFKWKYSKPRLVNKSNRLLATPSAHRSRSRRSARPRSRPGRHDIYPNTRPLRWRKEAIFYSTIIATTRPAQALTHTVH